ncbi:hypothetical protein Tco_0151437 [Tanacetum coccineum]
MSGAFHYSRIIGESSIAASEAAMYSTCVADITIVVCFLLFQVYCSSIDDKDITRLRHSLACGLHFPLADIALTYDSFLSTLNPCSVLQCCAQLFDGKEGSFLLVTRLSCSGVQARSSLDFPSSEEGLA